MLHLTTAIFTTIDMVEAWGSNSFFFKLDHEPCLDGGINLECNVYCDIEFVFLSAVLTVTLKCGSI